MRTASISSIVTLHLDVKDNPLWASLAFGPHSVNVAACSYINSHDFACSNKQRYLNGEAILERRFFPRAFLLRVRGRRCLDDSGFGHFREANTAWFSFEELYRQAHTWLQEFLCGPQNGTGDFNLLESLRIHECACTSSGEQEFHDVPLELDLFQKFLRAEVRLPNAMAFHVAQFGLHHSAQLGSSGLRFYFDNFVDLPLHADDHSCSQFACGNHRVSRERDPLAFSPKLILLQRSYLSSFDMLTNFPKDCQAYGPLFSRQTVWYDRAKPVQEVQPRQKQEELR